MCNECGIIKQPDDYYESNPTKCKECVKNRVRINYRKKVANPIWVEAERKRGREKYRRLGYVVNRPPANRKAEDIRKYKARYPEKERARTAAGSIKRPKGLTVHHWSYNSEHFKDVIFLTFKDHKKAHRFLVYDQSFKMYRRKDNNKLLDSKYKHERYIKSKIKNEED